MAWSIKTFFTYLQCLCAPPRCRYCRKALITHDVFCLTCAGMLRPALPHYIQLSTRMKVTVHAAALYDEPMRTLILQKHTANISSCYALAQLIKERTPFIQTAGSIIIPVPLHWTRAIARGFNQAEEIALQLAQYKNAQVSCLVKRHKKTTFQSTLSKTERKENVAQAFILNANAQQQKLRGKDLIIIDDLMTSGNTIRYTAQCLLPLSPKSITAFVACRACPQ